MPAPDAENANDDIVWFLGHVVRLVRLGLLPESHCHSIVVVVKLKQDDDETAICLSQRY